MSRIKYKKLSRDQENKTEIVAGNEKLSIEEVEKKESGVGKRLRSIEGELDKYGS